MPLNITFRIGMISTLTVIFLLLSLTYTHKAFSLSLSRIFHHQIESVQKEKELKEEDQIAEQCMSWAPNYTHWHSHYLFFSWHYTHLYAKKYSHFFCLLLLNSSRPMLNTLTYTQKIFLDNNIFFIPFQQRWMNFFYFTHKVEFLLTSFFRSATIDYFREHFGDNFFAKIIFFAEPCLSLKI